MDETLLKIRILARSEMTLAQVHARSAARRTLLSAIAIGLLVLTGAMLNVGLFHLLEVRIGAAGAAFTIAAINAVLAGLLVAVAARIRPGPEEQIVREIREMALAELSADAAEIKLRLDEVTTDLKRIRSGISTLTGSGGVGSLGALAPVLAMLTKALEQRRS